MARILIVDDSMITRRHLKKILREFGHEVLEADNGVAGLEKLRANDVDCLLLDLLMPQMGGLEVLQTLKSEGSTVPTIVLTADLQKTTRQACGDAGAAAVIIKPPEPGSMREALDMVLGSS